MSSTLLSAIISAAVSILIALISQIISHYRQKKQNAQEAQHNKTVQLYNNLLVKRQQDNMAIKAVIAFERIYNKYHTKVKSSNKVEIQFDYYQSLIKSIGIWSIYLRDQTSNISNIRKAIHNQFKVIDNQCWPVIEWNETVGHKENNGYKLAKKKLLL